MATYRTCPTCSGSGYVSRGDIEEQCGNCHGSGKVREFCFPASARVMTPIGWSPIGEVKAGQVVVSYNAADDAVYSRRVTRKLSHGFASIWEIRTANRRTPILTTPGHSFLTEHGWVLAKDLESDDFLLGINQKSGLVRERVLSSESTAIREPVFNLHTEAEHTFIVEGFVVHNFSYLRNIRTFLHRCFIDPVIGIRHPRPVSLPIGNGCINAVRFE